MHAHGKPLQAAIDPAEMRHVLEHAITFDPSLLDELLEIIGKEITPRKAAALFDYLFVPASRPADGTDNIVVGFRLRNADERLLARAALNGEKLGEGVHADVS